jgi:hypothetical protein
MHQNGKLINQISISLMSSLHGWPIINLTCLRRHCMISSIDNKITKTCWFVGALFEGSEDQTQRFIDEGVWENNYQDKY